MYCLIIIVSSLRSKNYIIHYCDWAFHCSQQPFISDGHTCLSEDFTFFLANFLSIIRHGDFARDFQIHAFQDLDFLYLFVLMVFCSLQLEKSLVLSNICEHSHVIPVEHDIVAFSRKLSCRGVQHRNLSLYVCLLYFLVNIES